MWVNVREQACTVIIVTNFSPAVPRSCMFSYALTGFLFFDGWTGEATTNCCPGG